MNDRICSDPPEWMEPDPHPSLWVIGCVLGAALSAWMAWG